MIIDNNNPKHIIAEEGKVFKRISDEVTFGKELYLGIAFYLNDTKLEEPLVELPEHFVEIDEVIVEDVPTENVDIANIITGDRLEENPSYIEDAVIVE